MPRLSYVILALVALASASEPSKPRLIDFNPWSWIPNNRNKSPSIMDYFFPPSRTPKQSNLDPPADRQPPTVQTTMDDAATMTTLNERPTTMARKSHNKIKTTIPAPRPTATALPKIKKTSHKTVPTETTVETKVTQTIKYESQTTKVPVTSRPTKHYSIRPLRTTEIPFVQETASTMNLNSDITETIAVETLGTTNEIVKETVVPTLSTDQHSTEGSSTITMDSTTFIDSTTEPADSREGYLPLRDKPQQTHVKINDQTKKEVRDFFLRND
ncbi:unnamed protein product [Pieris brassicae]|uniref:Uncharacterized protein n=1 Tax=Pieris brassicae TaxID=7116 RepID=A0A9P0X6W3_PIEBR|nr:unnamed protein product [Pieris brassicae]